MTMIDKKPMTLNRRLFLATGTAAIAAPFVLRGARAAAKTFRISTPGSAEEWQSKALETFKDGARRGRRPAPSTCSCISTARCSRRARRSRPCSAATSNARSRRRRTSPT